VSWRKLLASQTAIVELDSTDYDAMIELTRDINARAWPYEVALLGAATSQVVDAGSAFSAIES
jgi:hypothetical protein